MRNHDRTNVHRVRTGILQRCRIRLLTIGTALPLLTSCSDGRRPLSPEAPRIVVNSMVTDAVASRISANGQFANLTTALSDTAITMIDPDTAANIAERYIRVFGPYLRSPFDQLRGQRIDFQSLQRGPRVILADSPVLGVPAGGGRPLQKAFGPYFLVDFFAPDERSRTLTVAVSAFASDIQVTSEGVTSAGPFGNEFRVWVAPLGGSGEPRMSPEAAVDVAFRLLGRRVKSVPTFVRASPDITPHIGRWRLELESVTRVTNARNGEHLDTDVVFIDGDGVIEVPARDGRGAFSARYFSRTTNRPAVLPMTIRRGVALDFDPVVPR